MLKQSAPNWAERVPSCWNPASASQAPPVPPLPEVARWPASSHAPPTGWHSRFPAGLQAPTTRILSSLGFGKDRLPRKRAEPELPTWPSLLELTLLSRPGGPGEMTGLPAPPCRFPPPPLGNGHHTQHLPSAPAPSVLWTPCSSLPHEDAVCLSTETVPDEAGARPSKEAKLLGTHSPLSLPSVAWHGQDRRTPDCSGLGRPGLDPRDEVLKSPGSMEMLLRIFTR